METNILAAVVGRDKVQWGAVWHLFEWFAQTADWIQDASSGNDSIDFFVGA